MHRCSCLFFQCTQVFGWIFAITTCLLVVYGTWDWNSGNLPDWSVSVAYATSSRTVWTIGVAWITVVCYAGYGGNCVKDFENEIVCIYICTNIQIFYYAICFNLRLNNTNDVALHCWGPTNIFIFFFFPLNEKCMLCMSLISILC